MTTRCAWVSNNPLSIQYHDEEWGVPTFNDQRLFEFIILEGMQAGLNWQTILNKRENYRHSFDDFNAEKMAVYDADKYAELMNNPGIIRNRLKIQSAITNAQAFLTLKNECKLADYLWGFVDGKPIINHWTSHSDIPASTPLSDKLSKDLKKRGFKFVGSTICYAFMQAVGLVNDHTLNCLRHQQVQFLSI
jgi:DNA-3-methyladenine glycosylase I